MNKITIVVQDKSFELDLESFDAMAKEEIIATFLHQELDIQTLLRLYIQEIQKKHHINAQLEEILRKIIF